MAANLCPGLLQVFFSGLQAALQLGDLVQTGLVLILVELQGVGEGLQPDLRIGRQGLGLQQACPEPRLLDILGAQLGLLLRALSTQWAQSGADTDSEGVSSTTPPHKLSFRHEKHGLAKDVDVFTSSPSPPLSVLYICFPACLSALSHHLSVSHLKITSWGSNVFFPVTRANIG